MPKYKTLFFLFFFASIAFAQWPTTVDSALYVDNGIYPYLVVDEDDRSVIVAYLRDNGIRAKKFDKFGYSLWSGQRVVVSDTAYGWAIREYAYPSGQWGAAISDGEGGIIVAWEDYRHATFGYEGPEGSEVYLQRVDRDGNILYGGNGMKISGPASNGWHSIGDMKTDYTGGFYIGFSRDSTGENSLLKRFGLNGSLIWERLFKGLYIDVCATNEFGDVFININPWSGGSRQKLDVGGNLLWPDSLIGIINDDKSYRGGGAFSDKNGGIIGVGGAGYLKVRRVDSIGQYAWDEVDLNEQQQGRIGYTPDNKGGIYVCWTEDSMRIQRIDKYGNIKYNPPLKIHEKAGGTYIVNSYGGVITIFGKSGDDINDLYAQRFDSSGVKIWPDSGLAFHSTDDDFLWWPPRSIFSDMNNGAIFLWNEVGQGNRILMKQISYNGNLAEVTTNINESHETFVRNFIFFQNYPNPFNNSTTISFNTIKPGKVVIKVYNTLGQEILTIIDRKLSPGFYRIPLSLKNVASGIYYYQLQTDNQIVTKKMLLVQ